VARPVRRRDFGTWLTIQPEDRTFTIVGVFSPGFRFLYEADVDPAPRWISRPGADFAVFAASGRVTRSSRFDRAAHICEQYPETLPTCVA
jgi:hypothetical protein